MRESKRIFENVLGNVSFELVHSYPQFRCLITVMTGFEPSVAYGADVINKF